MIELDNMFQLVQMGKVVLDASSIEELYLTECVGCCCGKASYRLFKEKPKFEEVRGQKHPDTDLNSDRMLVKVYNEDRGLAKMIAKVITASAENISRTEGLPRNAIVYKLK
jgi:hypothetical protein